MYEDDFFFKKVNLISKISQQKGALNHFFFLSKGPDKPEKWVITKSWVC